MGGWTSNCITTSYADCTTTANAYWYTVPASAPVEHHHPETPNLDWLNERIDEMRIKL